MSGPIDPVTSLIKALGKTPGAPTAAQPAEPSDRLSEAAKSIPTRADTAVTDLLDSPELQAFRRAYIDGVVEANVINQVLDLLKGVLVAKGFIVG